MIAVVPVAGAGTRLRPHTFTLPKALLPVADKTILGHILDALLAHRVKEIVLVTGFLKEKIHAYVARHYPGAPIRFVEQPEPRGLGHAIWVTREAVTQGPMLIVLGDTLFDADLASLTPDGPNRLGVLEVDEPRRFGIVELNGDRISRLVEKPENPPTNLALVGLYYLTSSAPLFEALQALVDSGKTTKGEIQLTDALQIMIERGAEFRPLPITGWFDCGTARALLDANRSLLSRRPSSEAPPGTAIVPPVWLAPGCRVENAVLGPHVAVAPGAVVRDAVVRDSIVGEEARVEGALLESSLIGERAVVRGGFRRLNVGELTEFETA